MAAVRSTLVSGAQTATGQSAAYAVKTISMAAVCVNVTAASGSFAAWLQVSPDGGTTWHDFGHDILTKNDDGGAAGQDFACQIQRRNITGTSYVSAAAKFCAIYKHLASQYVRLSWYIAGTGATFTFTATLEGK